MSFYTAGALVVSSRALVFNLVSFFPTVPALLLGKFGVEESFLIG